MSGIAIKKCELKTGRTNVVEQMMPLDQFYVNTSILIFSRTMD